MLGILRRILFKLNYFEDMRFYDRFSVARLRTLLAISVPSIVMFHANALLAETFAASVNRVADGDTITVVTDKGEKHKIRLSGIDAPELDQPFGVDSREHLLALIDESQVACHCSKKDRYRRWICEVFIGQMNLNLQMVRDGYAWWYRLYKVEQTPVARLQYERAEAAARSGRLALWSDDLRVAPWDWRKQKREKRRRK